MATRKGSTSRRKKTSKTTKSTKASPGAISKADDWITIRYATIVYYVFVGLIIGLSIGALLLLWVSQVKANEALTEVSVQGQLLQTNPYIR